jgi:hypothetical protein
MTLAKQSRSLECRMGGWFSSVAITDPPRWGN